MEDGPEDESEADRIERLGSMPPNEWLRTRPTEVLRRVITHPPALYRLKTTNQKVLLFAYSEGDDGVFDECQVLVLRQYNPNCLEERRVFGIKLADLEILEMNDKTQDAIRGARRVLRERGEPE